RTLALRRLRRSLPGPLRRRRRAAPRGCIRHAQPDALPVSASRSQSLRPWRRHARGASRDAAIRCRDRLPHARGATMSNGKITGAFFALIALLGVSPAAARLNVVASIPDLGDMAREIGGDRVRVDVLASGREDFHAVPARPSFLPKLHRADLLLSLGLDAEHAWLPALAAEARNPRVREGGAGWIETWDGIRVLDVP